MWLFLFYKFDLDNELIARRMTTTTLPYKPLCEETGEIRLIVINPGNSPDPVICSFDTVLLTDTPTPVYDALSYAWGESEISREPIILHEQPLHVRLNLHAALQAIRSSTSATVLWIDAICINQSDLGERARQVRIMRDIFAKARKVLAWVGPLQDERDFHAMNLMTRIILEPEASAGEDTQGVIGLDNLHQNPLSSLYRFLSRPYWGRMWIVQELAVAQECWVLCGSIRRSFSDYISLPAKLLPLMRLEDLENSVSGEAADLAGTLTFTQMIDAVCQFRDNDCEIDLRGALEFLPGHVCSDPRDKVYAILGLCGEATRFAIVPDYSEAMTLVKLYRQVVEHCLDAEGNLTVLAGPRHFATQDDGLPSWCPRFDDIDQWLAKDPLDLRGPGLADSPSLRFIDHTGSGPTRLVVEALLGIPLSLAHPHPVDEPEYQHHARPLIERSLDHCAGHFAEPEFMKRTIDRHSDEYDRLRRALGVEPEGSPHISKRDYISVSRIDHKSNKPVSKGMDLSSLFTDYGACMLMPAVDQGPLYVKGEEVRKDITNGEKGIPMTLAIQVVDYQTCKVLPDAYVDIWSSNATGMYVGVQGYPGMGDPNDASILKGTTLRAIVYLGATKLQNNTLSGGRAAHVGQLYFDQSLVTASSQAAPYNTNRMATTLNIRDFLFMQGANGDDPIVRYALVGNKLEDGLFAWIRFGVRANANLPVNPAAFWTANGGVMNPTGPISRLGGGGFGWPGGKNKARAVAEAVADREE
ncbi:hypothetical protein PspLS_09620 [Pyricularia sp. CBS 133598]|nr:hypothetical protein PspLS_09620 [Pyricularia sp. CBS 133598]